MRPQRVRRSPADELVEALAGAPEFEVRRAIACLGRRLAEIERRNRWQARRDLAMRRAAPRN